MHSGSEYDASRRARRKFEPSGLRNKVFLCSFYKYLNPGFSRAQSKKGNNMLFFGRAGKTWPDRLTWR